MKYTEQMQYNEKCPHCENFLVLETVSWDGLSGSLYNVSCPLCKIKGENTRYKDVAFNNFLKKVAQKDKKEREKPEKILTDICTYLMERQRCLAIESRMCPKIRETALVLSMIEDLKKYAEKLGVEL